MTVDYPGATDMLITDPTRVFVDALLDVPPDDLSIVIHKTASNGPVTIEDIGKYFQTNPARISSHFIIDKDGTVAQSVLLKDGAAANCCVSQGYNVLYWGPLARKYGNLNKCTISIEHIDYSFDNSEPIPPLQMAASKALVLWLCKRYGLTTNNIHSHASIDPVNRFRCPGPTYDFNALFGYVNSGGQDINFIAQAAADTWNSTAHLFNNTPLPYDTGIAASWREKYINQHVDMPAPITPEFQSVAWDGTPITVQLFGNTRCEWYNGVAKWYTIG